MYYFVIFSLTVLCNPLHTAPNSTVDTAFVPLHTAPISTVDAAFVHLFEWKWDDIAQECEQFLGPMGYAAVQTSPQMEHIKGDQWWTRYQPVSYNTISRSGNNNQFRSMVKRCKAVGVHIYADPVPNHMASGSGTGIAGSTFGGRAFPSGGYGPQDMHHNQNDQSSNCQVNNYQDKNNVQKCDLVGLTDINTGDSYSQGHLAQYFKNLSSAGVAGFRIDAAKHQDSNEVATYLKLANSPWVFQEVIYGNNEAVQPKDYTHNGYVTEFRYGDHVGNAFKNGNLGSLTNLENGKLASKYALTFLDNHDTERGNAPITYKNGDLYRIANYFMLAYPYGYPKVMSSYYFNGHDQGPPSTPVHSGTKINCFAGKPWVCQHRWIGVGEMVAFRKAAGTQKVSNWVVDGRKLAFSRGNKAFIAINIDGSTWSKSLQTGLAPGQYCDIIQGLKPCHNVTVGSNGEINLNLEGIHAMAIHVNAKPDL